MKLSELAKGRDNNLNLIRICAAYSVLVSHSFALATGDENLQPFAESLNITIGTISVYVFFFVSGFLVTTSLVKRNDVISFIKARALRIYPALFVMNVAVVVVLSLLSIDEIRDYFFNIETIKYFIKNSIVVFGVNLYLPGVFVSNPYPQEVNSSLWTLPYEIRLYLALAVFYFLFVRVFRVSRKYIGLLLSGLVIFVYVSYFSDHWHGVAFFKIIPANLVYMFLVGVLLSFFSEKIVLSTRLAFFLSLVVFLSVFWVGYFKYVLMIVLPYLILYLAYIPRGVVRYYNKLGDYSYGVYIYAYPVQQTIANLFEKVSIPVMIIISSLLTLFLAVVSWHFIEKRALSLR